jgi:Tfp pilus assembly protein PilP
MATDLQATNFKMFLHTVNVLSGSQGFYSRLQRDINEWTAEERANAEKQINSLPKFKDEVDVVLWLEQ